MGSQVKAINYRRRRVLAVVFVIVSLLGLAMALVQPQSAGASADAGKADFTYVYVQSGDTLWSIATNYAPEKDPQQEIADIKNLNNLDSSTVVPGQRLALP
jgi:LysM repeat protein